ncbi:MAG: hypothetical protein EPO12_18275 [Aquabacterium sp.]|nr:MAG: hypothetical protein EPO12_18275 [Aquabacterium sp.]
MTTDPKTLATLQARAALIGVQLVLSVDERGRQVFIASRWGLTKELDSVEAVEAFMLRVGGSRAG